MMRLARRAVIGGALGMVGIGLIGLATARVTTRQGVNFQISTTTIPCYVKVLAFLDRHYQYQLLSNDIVRGCRSDQDRALAIFQWTRQHIRPAPADWPIVDDHVWHIIIRGYGVGDQMADVFTTLTSYAHVPAFWHAMRFHHVAGKAGLILSFAKINSNWRVFDVEHGIVFHNRRGELATFEELVADPELVMANVGAEYPIPVDFSGLKFPAVPYPLRSELQMPWPRLWYELVSVIQ